MLLALSDEKVKYLLIGAYALAAHGYPRATMDIDIWVMPSPQNADAVMRALRRFGDPLQKTSRRMALFFRLELPQDELILLLQHPALDLRKRLHGHFL